MIKDVTDLRRMLIHYPKKYETAIGRLRDKIEELDAGKDDLYAALPARKYDPGVPFAKKKGSTADVVPTQAAIGRLVFGFDIDMIRERIKDLEAEREALKSALAWLYYLEPRMHALLEQRLIMRNGWPGRASKAQERQEALALHRLYNILKH